MASLFEILGCTICQKKMSHVFLKAAINQSDLEHSNISVEGILYSQLQIIAKDVRNHMKNIFLMYQFDVFCNIG